MKKTFALLLALLMAVSMLTACQNVTPPEGNGEQNQPPVTPPVGDVIPEYDGTVTVKPGDPTTPPEGEDQPTTPPEDSGDQPDTPPESGEDQPTMPPESGEVVTGDFVTKYKTYTYEGNNLAIIKLENHTSQNYTVTINAKYLDAAGNELKAEIQTFEGFPAGWENHLVFKPDIQFAKFTYTVSLNVFNGECDLSANSKAYLKRLYEGPMFIRELAMNKGDYTKYPSILAEFELVNCKNLSINMWQIILDSTGEIFFITYLEAEISNASSTKVCPLLQTTEKTIVWPDELKGNVNGIVAVQSATN